MAIPTPVLVIATRNPGKRREFAELFAGLPIDLQDLSSFPDAPIVEERHDTYLANAHDKALTIGRFTGLPALADDSGLEVDALGGQPGVRSARYAGNSASDRDNIDLLLRTLHGTPDAERSARFRCVIVVALPNGDTLQSEGVCEGRIARQASGMSGFGYDPVFYYPPAKSTFAELAGAEKNRVSHRARACQRLRPQLLDFLRRA